MLAFILLLAQGCQEDYEMIDPPMMTDYDDDLDEEVIMQKGLESYFVTQFGEGEMDGSSWHPCANRRMKASIHSFDIMNKLFFIFFLF